jgi:hypothetical protein
VSPGATAAAEQPEEGAAATSAAATVVGVPVVPGSPAAAEVSELLEQPVIAASRPRIMSVAATTDAV